MHTFTRYKTAPDVQEKKANPTLAGAGAATFPRTIIKACNLIYSYSFFVFSPEN